MPNPRECPLQYLKHLLTSYSQTWKHTQAGIFQKPIRWTSRANFHEQKKTLGISFLSVPTQGRTALKAVHLEDIRAVWSFICVDFYLFLLKTDSNIFNPLVPTFLETVACFQLKSSEDSYKKQTLNMKNLQNRSQVPEKQCKQSKWEQLYILLIKKE